MTILLGILLPLAALAVAVVAWLWRLRRKGRGPLWRRQRVFPVKNVGDKADKDGQATVQEDAELDGVVPTGAELHGQDKGHRVELHTEPQRGAGSELDNAMLAEADGNVQLVGEPDARLIGTAPVELLAEFR